MKSRFIQVVPVLLAAVLALSTSSAYSQEDTAWRRGRSTTLNQSSVQSGSGASRQFSSVSRRTDSASEHAAGNAEVDRTQPVPSDFGFQGFPDPLRPGTDVDTRKLEKERRYRELQNRIRSLLERGQPAQENEPKSSQPSEILPALPADEEAPESDVPKATEDSPGSGLNKPEEEHEEPEVVDLSAVGHRMVDSPIDRVALANNLYVVGEFGLALKMYESIDGTSLSADDENWVRLQIAGCLRKLGRRAEAQQKYRQLAARPEAGQVNELARWWLQQMNERAALEEDLKRYENVIRIQKESIDAAGATEQ